VYVVVDLYGAATGVSLCSPTTVELSQSGTVTLGLANVLTSTDATMTANVGMEHTATSVDVVTELADSNDVTSSVSAAVGVITSLFFVNVKSLLYFVVYVATLHKPRGR